MVVGFIGFGEAAYAIASGLGEAVGAPQIVAYDAYRSLVMAQRGKQIGVRLCETLAELGASSDVIVSLVPASSALEVARGVAHHVKDGAVYADLNSCSPRTKQRISEVFSATKAEFASVAVMSAVLPFRHRVPMIADGPGALRLQESMSPYGMQIRTVDGEIGSSAVIKMCRSVIVKGMESLLLEALLAAQTAGVADEVLESVDASFSGMTFTELTNYLLIRNMRHGERRAHELREAVETVSDLGVQPLVTSGAAQRLEWSADCQKNGKQIENPQSFKDVLGVLLS